MDCLFCSIAAGEASSYLVHEDDDFVGFLDVRPVFKGHVLLIPRQHIATLPDHCHVVPRTKGDGLRGFFWPRTKYVDGDEATSYARRLRAALE